MPTNDAFPVAIRRSQRARQVRLVVKPAGVELVVPPHVSEVQALTFLHQQRPWVERKLTEMQGRLKQNTHLREPLASGSTVPFQGGEVPLVVRQHAGSRLRIARTEDGPFEIALPAASSAPVDLQVRTALFAWVTQWMRIEAARLAHGHGHASGLLPRDIRIKRMKTRWGSCGPRNDINLNWVLAFAPPSVLDYVVVHELAHLKVSGHNPRFWGEVAKVLPDYAARRRWLNREGSPFLLWRV